MLMRHLVLPIVVAATSAQADIVRSPEAWTVAPNFEKNSDARKALSGAACVAGTNHCFAVNDEKKYAQFFDIDGRTIVPAELIRLLPDEVDGVEMDEIDAEGVAYVDAAAPGEQPFFYVTGSHGLSRKGALQPSRFFLLRFPVDPATGRPSFPFGDDEAAPEVARTAQLRETIKNAADLAAARRAAARSQRGDDRGHRGQRRGRALRASQPLCRWERLRHAGAAGRALPGRRACRVDQRAGARRQCRRPRSREGRGRGADPVRPQRRRSGRPASYLRRGADTHSPAPAVWFWSGKEGDPAKPLGELPGVAVTDRRRRCWCSARTRRVTARSCFSTAWRTAARRVHHRQVTGSRRRRRRS